MEITLTNRELMVLFETIKKLSGRPCGIQFAYALAKNLQRISGDCEALASSINQQRQVIIDELCLRDAAGQPVIANDEYQFSDENRRVFELKMIELRQEVNTILSQTTTVDLHMVNLESLPAEVEPQTLQGLLPMIREGSNG